VHGVCGSKEGSLIVPLACLFLLDKGAKTALAQLPRRLVPHWRLSAHHIRHAPLPQQPCTNRPISTVQQALSTTHSSGPFCLATEPMASEMASTSNVLLEVAASLAFQMKPNSSRTRWPVQCSCRGPPSSAAGAPYNDLLNNKLFLIIVLTSCKCLSCVSRRG
jgi:hypothetical protein